MKPERGAFETSYEQPGDRCVGLTVRAYIATQIMKGLVANPSLINPISIPENVHELTAKSAALFADALLKSLNEP